MEKEDKNKLEDDIQNDIDLDSLPHDDSDEGFVHVSPTSNLETELPEIRRWFTQTFPGLSEEKLEQADGELLKTVKGGFLSHDKKRIDELRDRSATPTMISGDASDSKHRLMSETSNTTEFRKVNSELEELKKKLEDKEGEFDILKSENDMNKGKLVSAEDHVNRLKTKISDFQNINSELEKSKKALEDKEGEFDILKSENDMNKAKLASAEEYAGRLKIELKGKTDSVVALKSEKDAISSALESTRSECDRIKSQLDETEEKLQLTRENLEEKNLELENCKATAEKEIEELNEKKSELEIFKTNAEKEIEQLNVKIENSEKFVVHGDSIIKDLKKELREKAMEMDCMRARIKNMEQDIENKTRELKRAEPQMRIASHLLKYSENVTNELETQKFFLKEANEKVTKLEAERGELQTEIHDYKTVQIPTLRNSVNKLSDDLNKQNEEMDRIKTQWNTDKASLNQYKEQLKRKEQEYNSKEKSHQDLQDKFNALKAEKETLARDKRELEEQLKTKEKELNSNIYKLEEKLKTKDKEFNAKDKSHQELSGLITKSNKEVENLKEQLKLKEQEFNLKDKSHQELSAKCSQIEKEYSEKQKRIEELQKVITERDETIEDCRKRIRNAASVDMNNECQSKVTTQQPDLSDNRSKEKAGPITNVETTKAEVKHDEASLLTVTVVPQGSASSTDQFTKDKEPNKDNDDCHGASSSTDQFTKDKEPNKDKDDFHSLNLPDPNVTPVTTQPTNSSRELSTNSMTFQSSSHSEARRPKRDPPKNQTEPSKTEQCYNIEDISVEKLKKMNETFTKDFVCTLNSVTFHGVFTLKCSKRKISLGIKPDYRSQYKNCNLSFMVYSTVYYKGSDKIREIQPVSMNIKDKDKTLAEFSIDKEKDILFNIRIKIVALPHS